MEITFNKKTVKAINKWLRRNGFGAECVFVKGDELAYDPNDDTILIAKHYNDEPDTLFMKCLRDLGLTGDFDATTLSILHELGHSQTSPMLSRKEWEKCAWEKFVLSATTDPTSDESRFKYWEIADEYAANNWAVMFVRCFPKKVEKLEKIIEENVKFG